jgi:hypothetical protein
MEVPLRATSRAHDYSTEGSAYRLIIPSPQPYRSQMPCESPIRSPKLQVLSHVQIESVLFSSPSPARHIQHILTSTDRRCTCIVSHSPRAYRYRCVISTQRRLSLTTFHIPDIWLGSNRFMARSRRSFVRMRCRSRSLDWRGLGGTSPSVRKKGGVDIWYVLVLILVQYT